MVRYRKPLERSEDIIDLRPFDAARRGRGAAGAGVIREEQVRLQRMADENMKAALRLRRYRSKKN